MKPCINDRLQHIVDSIEHIESFLREDKDLSEYRTASAIFYQLLVIGEAVRHVPGDLRKHFGDLPWLSMMGLRNILAHEYFRIEIHRISTAIEQLPKLKQRIKDVIAYYETCSKP